MKATGLVVKFSIFCITFSDIQAETMTYLKWTTDVFLIVPLVQVHWVPVTRYCIFTHLFQQVWWDMWPAGRLRGAGRCWVDSDIPPHNPQSNSLQAHWAVHSWTDSLRLSHTPGTDDLEGSPPLIHTHAHTRYLMMHHAQMAQKIQYRSILMTGVSSTTLIKCTPSGVEYDRVHCTWATFVLRLDLGTVLLINPIFFARRSHFSPSWTLRISSLFHSRSLEIAHLNFWKNEQRHRAVKWRHFTFKWERWLAGCFSRPAWEAFTIGWMIRQILKSDTAALVGEFNRNCKHTSASVCGSRWI